MALISQQLPNLIGGISQQSPEFRRPNQCSDSLNTYNDPVLGVSKRAGSEYLNKINAPIGGEFGSIERDEFERYIFHVSSAGVRVWDSQGVPAIVNTPEGVAYLSGTSTYKFTSVADTTFIVNPTVVVSMSSVLTPASTCSGLIFIRAIDAGVRYSVNVSGVGASAVSYTAPTSGAIDTGVAAASLAASLDAQPNITAAAIGPVVRYTVTGTYTVSADSSRGDSYLTLINGVVTNFGDLPETSYDGCLVKVIQNPTTDVDDYYVRFQGAATGSSGVWVEASAPGIPTGLNKATMPHVLVRESDGSFTFKSFLWAGRVVGDEGSNPNPSFVGNTIANILFENNRLGLLSDVNIILSESSGLSNFFRTTVSTIVDSDPIDLAVSGRQVSQLKTFMGVKDGILLFSENGQFLLSIGDADILSPETASITAVSSYQSNTRVDPARVGDSIMFVTRKDAYSGVREYFYQSGRDYTQSSGITGHVPQLLPNDIKLVVGSSAENIVFFSPNSGSTLYVYQYLFSGEEKIVSAWSKWSFEGADIRFATVFGDHLYLVAGRDTVTTLERVRLSNRVAPLDLPSEVHLDSYSSSKGSARAIVGSNTIFTLGRLLSTSSPVLVSSSLAPEYDVYPGDTITPLSVQTVGMTTQITLPGSWIDYDFYIGDPFVFYYEMSPLYIRLEDGDVEIGGRLQIRNVLVSLYKTGDCKFRVVYAREGVVTTVLDIGSVLDWSDIADMSTLQNLTTSDDGGEIYALARAFPTYSLESRLQLVDYSYTVPVMCKNTGYRLRIESDSWQPTTISKIQWEALFHKRSR